MPPHGRAAAKGLQPRAAARYMVTTKFGENFQFSIFFHFFQGMNGTNYAWCPPSSALQNCDWETLLAMRLWRP